MSAESPVAARSALPSGGNPPIVSSDGGQTATYSLYTSELKTPLAPVRFRFNVLSVEPLDGLYYKVFPLDKAMPPYFREVRSPGRSRSDTYDYNGPDPLELYWLPSHGQLGAPRLALRHEFGRRDKSMLVLTDSISEAKAACAPLEFFDLDLCARNFPPGSYVVINLSNVPLAGCFDGKLYRPLPRVISSQSKTGDLNLDIYAYIERQDRIVNVTRSKLWISPNNRYWICFFPGAKNPEKIFFSAFYEVVRIDKESNNDNIIRYNNDMKKK